MFEVARMAKKKSTLSKSTPGVGGSSDAILPPFNEEALSTLTARIEKGLDKTQQPPSTAPSKKFDHGRKDICGNGPQGISSSKNSELRRGTKRDANGKAKTSGIRLGNDRSPATQNAQVADSNAALLQEILALGGTEEDLELVADVESDEEGVSNAGPSLDKSLRKELASFVAGLGIEKNMSSPEDEPIDEEEDSEEASGSDVLEQLETETVEAVEKEQAPIPQKTVTAPDNVNRLVSNLKREELPQTDSP